MARSGRRRKIVRRQPNGQPYRAPVDVRLVVREQPHRKRFGEFAHDHRAECELGRLAMDGIIDQPQYDAGVEYREVVRDMRIAIGAPPGTPAALDYMREGGRGNDREETEEAAKRANRARSVYADAYAALSDAGRNATIAVNDLTVWDKPRQEVRGGLDEAKRGLNMLARHFGLLGNRR